MGNYGSVDWSNQKIQATGIGAGNPNLPLPSQRAAAIRAAKLDAWRNLLEAIKGVSLTSETTVRNAMVENDVIVTRVEGILKGFTTVGEPRYLSDGSVEVMWDNGSSNTYRSKDLLLYEGALSKDNPNVAYKDEKNRAAQPKNVVQMTKAEWAAFVGEPKTIDDDF